MHDHLSKSIRLAAAAGNNSKGAAGAGAGPPGTAAGRASVSAAGAGEASPLNSPHRHHPTSLPRNHHREMQRYNTPDPYQHHPSSHQQHYYQQQQQLLPPPQQQQHAHPHPPQQQQQQQLSAQQQQQQIQCRKNLQKMMGISPSDIDKYSRIFFPISFTCFNLMYWIIYLHVSDEIASDLVMLHPD